MSASKAIKTIAITAVAQSHHNAVKIRNVLRWLKSGHEVRVQISGKADRQKAMENVLKDLEVKTRTGAKIMQKIVKPDSIKFYLRPTEDAANIVIDKDIESQSEDLDQVTEGDDIFSKDFEETLNKSIEEEKKRSKKK